MSSTRERDAFPKTLFRCARLMFSSTEASTFQWESSVFVSPIKAPALMILDEYGAEDRSRFSGSVVLDGMVLAHRLPEFEFESLPVLLDHRHKERRYAGTAPLRSGALEGDPVQQLPKVRWQVNPRCFVGAFGRLNRGGSFCHEFISIPLLTIGD